jgi:hypothetical protein
MGTLTDRHPGGGSTAIAPGRSTTARVTFFRKVGSSFQVGRSATTSAPTTTINSLEGSRLSNSLTVSTV